MTSKRRSNRKKHSVVVEALREAARRSYGEGYKNGAREALASKPLFVDTAGRAADVAPEQPESTEALFLRRREKAITEALVTAGERRRVLVEYLRMKFGSEDWHGVADAAMDLRELDERLSTLRGI